MALKTPALPREEWDFSEVPNNELVACCYWEYARESAFIREVLHSYREWWLAGGRRDEGCDALFARMDRIQSLGEVSNVIVRGCSFDPRTVWQCVDPDSDSYRHPDAPQLTGSFPAAWQSLNEDERKCRSHIRTDRKAIPLVPFQRGYSFFAADIARWCESQRKEAQRFGREIHPSLFSSGSETGVFQIEWGAFTNDELTEGFRQWVKANRPKRFPKPSGQGRKPGDLRAQLTRLAVMRLLFCYKASEIFTPRNDDTRAVFESKQFAGQKWVDATKWNDARREAGQVFRRLFPFLPPAEKPRSWERRPPGK